MDASPSSCGSQGWCEAAPHKLQLQLALLLAAADVAGTDCVFSGAMKQEITGTFSAVSLREKKDLNFQHANIMTNFHWLVSLKLKKIIIIAAGRAVYSLERAVPKVKDNVLFIREVGVLEVMYIVNTIHPNQDRNRNVWAVF